MHEYLSKIGRGDIAKETPDTSVNAIRNSNNQLSLVSTIDFFYPLVEDPYMQGRIGFYRFYLLLLIIIIFFSNFLACCNVLSDLYAMGIEHVDNVLMVLGISLKMNEKEKEVVTC